MKRASAARATGEQGPCAPRHPLLGVYLHAPAKHFHSGIQFNLPLPRVNISNNSKSTASFSRGEDFCPALRGFALSPCLRPFRFCCIVKTHTRPALSAQALDIVASRFKILANPMRLRLLQALESGEKNVTQLIETTGGQQANVSKHLAALAEAGMVARRKSGLNVFYFIADRSISDLCALMCSRLQKEFDQKAAHFS